MLPSDKLTHSRDLESRPLDYVRDLVEVCIGGFCNCGTHRARTGYSNVYNAVRLTGPWKAPP